MSDDFLSKLDLNVEEEEDTERHRRHIKTRPIRQIQREVDYPVESLDKITERIQQEIKRRQLASATSPSTATSSSATSLIRCFFIQKKILNFYFSTKLSINNIFILYR